MTRGTDGRVIVALHFKGDPTQLDNSSNRARQSFLSLERRLSRNPTLYDRYRCFMREYEELGHMSPTVGSVTNGYHLPHHCVFKDTSLTTKLRVVFNGSAPTSSGKSLNDLLMIGPTLQDDLLSIMIRMRCHRYVLTAYITKMYRQVLIRQEDRMYQRIWWRENPTAELRSYDLNTVTYGTAAASYLAIKTLRAVAVTESVKYPLGASRCLSDFYVDDFITGSDSPQELMSIRQEAMLVLRSGGFTLNKWASNHAPALNGVASSKTDVIIHAHTDDVLTLGMRWNTNEDTIRFQRSSSNAQSRLSRRTLLSRLCKNYDPLGLIGPIIVTGKILMQETWKLQIGEDDALPDTLIDKWGTYERSLDAIDQIIAPRPAIGASQTIASSLELHGFADASERAHGAAIYLVTVVGHRRSACHLLCAKSRVSPLKALSIPRLELAAALLLAELHHYVHRALRRPLSATRFYSDSEIVLAWIKSESRLFKTYVSNRVGEVQRLTNPLDWQHVASEQNPADLLIRGLATMDLLHSELWWHGPSFLLGDEPRPNITSQPPPPEGLPEFKCNVAVKPAPDIQTYGTFSKTVRVWAYVHRFIAASRHNPPPCQHLTVSELHNARTSVVRSLQAKYFPTELHLLQNQKPIQASSQLLPLNPFLDDDGILRLGGRMQFAPMHFNVKHPIFLPQRSPTKVLVIRDVHVQELHTGVQGSLAALRRRY